MDSNILRNKIGEIKIKIQELHDVIIDKTKEVQNSFRKNYANLN